MISTYEYMYTLKAFLDMIKSGSGTTEGRYMVFSENRMFIGAAAERLTISVDFELSSWG